MRVSDKRTMLELEWVLCTSPGHEGQSTLRRSFGKDTRTFPVFILNNIVKSVNFFRVSRSCHITKLHFTSNLQSSSIEQIFPRNITLNFKGAGV